MPCSFFCTNFKCLCGPLFFGQFLRQFPIGNRTDPKHQKRIKLAAAEGNTTGQCSCQGSTRKARKSNISLKKKKKKVKKWSTCYHEFHNRDSVAHFSRNKTVCNSLNFVITLRNDVTPQHWLERPLHQIQKTFRQVVVTGT